MNPTKNPQAEGVPDPDGHRLSRRDVFRTGAALAGAGALVPAQAQTRASPAMTPSPTDAAELPPQRMSVQLRINGQPRQLSVDTRTTLLDLLRENLQLTGSKKGCDHGQCGACTVLVEGRRTNACLSLAVMHDGQSVTTIEGLAKGDALHPLQQAFLKHDGFQCGYCTPGQICSAAGMLEEAKLGMPSHVTRDLAAAGQPLGDEEIRERMSGNLCRCSAYPNIVAAIKDVSGARS
ncbi:MAG: 2Fe-2S iron-sulfur cluster binding domain-containing protein [Comamonadaceae bacterium]|nr:MAG: 2Fe-2S iron-sulfur cluster binding domain-containing protein [Comamonadaceae bacterium]